MKVEKGGLPADNAISNAWPEFGKNTHITNSQCIADILRLVTCSQAILTPPKYVSFIFN